ncbi:MAG: hypothetical protein M1834_002790 [Cirrosporium novae-zelandiae]|nr:MAG: hypothetical protein M1834_002790 [Cirrosporium novae-zelandiae]
MGSLAGPSIRPLPQGVYVPTLTFFKENEELDLPTLKSHVVRLARAGVSGITTQGSNGEAVHLSHSERKLATSAVREALDSNNFKNMPIIVGCAAQSTQETIELCKDAASCGGDYALILPPSYYKGFYTRASLLGFFTDVATASPIPLLIYNYPGAASGTDLTSDDIIELAKHPKIVGCKLTCGNTGKLARIAAATASPKPSNTETTPPPFLVLGGSADFTLQTLVAGGHGVLAGLGNVAPKALIKLFHSYQSADRHEAQALQGLVARGDWAAIRGNVVGTKAGLRAWFNYGGYGRRPFPRPTAEEDEIWKEGFGEIVALENSLA